MNSCNEITLSSISVIVSSLRSVVAEFYGPQCSQTLLTTTTGKAVVTSDGYTIIEALSPEHPVAELVFKALKGCHAHTQDGCKLFLLYLDNILKELDHVISQGKLTHTGVNRAGNKAVLHKHEALCARQNLQRIMSEVLPRISQQILSHCLHLFENLEAKETFQSIAQCICKTTLMPHFSPKVSDFLAKVLVSAILEEELADKFIPSLQSFVDKFYSVIVKVPSRPYSETTVLDPFLIKRKFSVKCENFGSQSIKAIILVSGVDQTLAGDDNKEILQVKHSGQITNILLHRQRTVQAFADSCVKHGINLLICTECVPNYAADIFQRQGISVIPYVLNEDVEIIHTLTNTISLQSVKDEISNLNIVSLQSVTELIIGGEMHLQLKTELLPWKHLVICGPTVGLCDQAAMMCHKALTSVRNCFVSHDEILSIMKETDITSTNMCNESIGETCDKVENLDPKKFLESIDSFGTITDTKKVKSKIVVIQGGGSFEVLISSMLKDYQTNCCDSNLSATCDVLEKAFVGVVHVLYRNTNTITDNKRGFIETMTVLEEKARCGSEMWGLDRRGLPGDMAERRVLEPVMCKMHILQCVLNLIDQLLGTDKIVSVRKLAPNVENLDIDE